MRVDRTQAQHVERLLVATETAGVEVPELTEAARTEQRLAGWLDDTVAQARSIRAGNVVTLSAEAVVAAAQAGGKRPAGFTAAIIEAEQRERVLALEERVLVVAHDDAAMAVVSIVSEAIIATMRPVHDDILTRVRELAPTLAGIDVDDAETVLAATPKVQSARAELSSLRRRFDALRSAWGAIVDDDTRGSDYAVLRAPERAWGSSWQGRRIASYRPWPAGSLAYLLWLSQTEGEPWLPTSDDVVALETEERERDRAKRGASFVSLRA